MHHGKAVLTINWLPRSSVAFSMVRRREARTRAAWFDAGYFAETQREAARIFPNVHPGEQVDGMSWMRMAIRLGGSGMQTAVAEVERARAEWR